MAFRARQRQLTGAANSLLFRTSHTAVRSIITAHRTYATEADKANSKAGLEGLSQEERAVIEASRKTKAQNQPQQQQQAPETFKITEVKSARTRNHSTLKIRKYDPLEKRGSTLFESNQVASQLIKQASVLLRDACTCSLCVDPSTSQKNFQTSQIPHNIQGEVQSPSATASEVTIKWTNDIAGFPAEHKSTFPKPLIDAYLGTYIDKRKSPLHSWMPDTVKAWKKKDLQKRYLDFDYNRVLTDDEHLLNALRTLKSRGFIFLQNIPKEQQNAPLELGNRIGRLRDTFYGLTWDVKSVAKAKNVAYTHQFLGFHMDLLYFANPPGYQMLQCIQNSCEGGASMFVDSFAAAMAVRKMQKAKYEVLKREDAVGYHYHNNGEHYRFAHPVIETWGPRGPHEVITNVNYSPPFQAPFVFPSGVPAEKKIERVREMRNALETFAKETEKEEYIFEHKLAEGEMVLFNNRRVLHARREFEPGTGERWLKGGYIDTDVVMSKLRVLSETVGDAEQMKVKEDRIEDSKAMSNDAEVSEVVEEKVDEAVA